MAGVYSRGCQLIHKVKQNLKFCKSVLLPKLLIMITTLKLILLFGLPRPILNYRYQALRSETVPVHHFFTFFTLDLDNSPSALPSAITLQCWD